MSHQLHIHHIGHIIYIHYVCIHTYIIYVCICMSTLCVYTYIHHICVYMYVIQQVISVPRPWSDSQNRTRMAKAGEFFTSQLHSTAIQYVS